MYWEWSQVMLVRSLETTGLMASISGYYAITFGVFVHPCWRVDRCDGSRVSCLLPGPEPHETTSIYCLGVPRKDYPGWFTYHVLIYFRKNIMDPSIKSLWDGVPSLDLCLILILVRSQWCYCIFMRCACQLVEDQYAWTGWPWGHACIMITEWWGKTAGQCSCCYSNSHDLSIIWAIPTI